MDSSNLEDLRLPLAVVKRLIKDAIPNGISVSKEATLAIARSAAIFVVHATSFANEYALAHNRKNITAADVFHAIKILECDELEKPIVEAMDHFKMQRDQRNEQRKLTKQNKPSTELHASSVTEENLDETMENEN